MTGQPQQQPQPQPPPPVRAQRRGAGMHQTLVSARAEEAKRKCGRSSHSGRLGPHPAVAAFPASDWGRMAPTANGAAYTSPGITRRGSTLTDPERLEKLGRATIGSVVLHGRGIGARV
jgi:hypothetical protein